MIKEIPVIWDTTKIKFNWELHYCIDPYPKDDPWKTTDLVLEQENYYKSWGIKKESTEHYHSFDTELDFKTAELFKYFNGDNHTLNFMMIPPGMTIPWHRDTYSYYINTTKIPLEDSTQVHRSVIMMQDWTVGQVIQIEDTVLTKWNAGYTYTWPHNAWHGAANFGPDPMIFMQVNFKK